MLFKRIEKLENTSLTSRIFQRIGAASAGRIGRWHRGETGNGLISLRRSSAASVWPGENLKGL